MWKKIRRNSKQLLEPRRGSSVGIPPEPGRQSTTISERKLTFFDIPAELRNVIYEDVASSTSLHVLLHTKKPNKLPPPTPSLFLVCKQTRQEYVPLLLEYATISLLVKGFDFRDVMRITSSLYSTELKALRNNKQLTIQLVAEKTSKDGVASLRRWLVDRSNGLDRLGWHYSIAWPKATQIFPTSTQVHRINTYIQRRSILNQNLEAMSQLHHNVDETLQFELQPIVATFERELDEVGADPDLPWRDAQAEAALFLYGVTMRSARR